MTDSLVRSPRRHAAGGALSFIVVSWWLLLGGFVIWLLPERDAVATPRSDGIAVGQDARINQPGIRQWPVPAQRAGFDAFQRGTRESDETAMDEAFAVSEWIAVEHGQAVRIVSIDGDVVQIELRDGPHAGRRAWLKRRNLSLTS